MPTFMDFFTSHPCLPSLIFMHGGSNIKTLFNLAFTCKALYNQIFFSSQSIDAIRETFSEHSKMEGIDLKTLPPESVIKYAKDFLTKLELKEAIDRGDKLIMLTSPAGCGKTHILNKLCEKFKVENGEYQTGPTGTSSTMLPNGRTLHSLFQFLIPYAKRGESQFPRPTEGENCLILQEEGKYIVKQAIMKVNEVNERIQKGDFRAKKLREKINLIRAMKTLRIDEISMVSFALFLYLDTCMREIKGCNEPWGGIRLIMSGDFCQLKPVCTSDNPDDGHFVLKTPWWKKVRVFFLRFSYRQASDSKWAEVCSEIRSGKIGFNTIRLLNQRRIEGKSISIEEEENTTFVFEHNVDVDSHNERMLKNCKGEEFVVPREHIIKKCKGGIGCDVPVFNNAVAMDKFITERSGHPAQLRLKIGSKIMVTRNDIKNSVVNGSIGTVKNFEEKEGLNIILKDGREHLLKYSSIDLKEPCGCEISVSVIPVKSSYAFTVHKCQGMTLTNGLRACISNNTMHDKFYTLVTRTKRVDEISFPMSFVPNIVGQDKEVLEFYSGEKDLSPFKLNTEEEIDKEDKKNNNNPFPRQRANANLAITNGSSKTSYIKPKEEGDWVTDSKFKDRFYSFLSNMSMDVKNIEMKKRKVEIIDIT
jgi:ATP-dependent DNA helicase PIF1